MIDANDFFKYLVQVPGRQKMVTVLFSSIVCLLHRRGGEIVRSRSLAGMANCAEKCYKTKTFKLVPRCPTILKFDRVSR